MVNKNDLKEPKTKTSSKTTKNTEATIKKIENHDNLKNSLKNELLSYIDEKLDDRLIDKIEKTNKALLREKTRKIWARNFMIIVLLGIIVFETYILYQNGFIHKLLNRTNNESALNENNSIIAPENPNNSSNPKTPTLDELKEKYAGLLNNLKISKNSAYFSDYNSGILTNELKLYFALNSLDFGALEIEEDYNLVPATSITAAAETLFGTSDLKLASFDYNGNRLRYFEPLGAFVSSELLQKPSESLIALDISEIKEEGEDVIIKTSTGLIFNFKNKKLSSLSKN